MVAELSTKVPLDAALPVLAARVLDGDKDAETVLIERLGGQLVPFSSRRTLGPLVTPKAAAATDAVFVVGNLSRFEPRTSEAAIYSRQFLDWALTALEEREIERIAVVKKEVVLFSAEDFKKRAIEVIGKIYEEYEQLMPSEPIKKATAYVLAGKNNAEIGKLIGVNDQKVKKLVLEARAVLEEHCIHPAGLRRLSTFEEGTALNSAAKRGSLQATQLFRFWYTTQESFDDYNRGRAILDEQMIENGNLPLASVVTGAEYRNLRKRKRFVSKEKGRYYTSPEQMIAYAEHRKKRIEQEERDRTEGVDDPFVIDAGAFGQLQGVMGDTGTTVYQRELVRLFNSGVVIEDIAERFNTDAQNVRAVLSRSRKLIQENIFNKYGLKQLATYGDPSLNDASYRGDLQTWMFWNRLYTIDDAVNHYREQRR